MSLTVKQIKPVNLNITTALGWCLRDVRRAYGIGDQFAKYKNARTAWEASRTKHTMAELPKQNMLVPVWIRYGAISTNDHIVIYNPATGVYYSQDNNSGKFIAYASYQAWANRVRSYKPSILGWTEDVEDVQVLEVTKSTAPAPTPQPTPPPTVPTPSNTPNIGDKVKTIATHDAQNKLKLNLAVINDGQSVWTENNSKGNAVLRKGGIIRCAVPPSTLRRV